MYPFFLFFFFASCKVAGPIWPTGFTRLCGINSDQHFYVHINPAAQGETVDLIINTVTRTRYKFGFWVTQIDCTVDSNLEAPPGCTQFHLGDQGTIKTFNFEGVQYLTNTNYRVCIRSELNACYMVFQVDSNQFFLQVTSRILFCFVTPAGNIVSALFNLFLVRWLFVGAVNLPSLLELAPRLRSTKHLFFFFFSFFLAELSFH